MTRLGEIGWPELEARTLVVPVGACEQHGPHLPFDTDTRIATAVAERVAAAVPAAVAAPAVAFGSSGEHQDFPGTLSIGPEALHALLVELIRSATCTFARVLLLNAHGGNVPTLARAVEHQQGEGRDVRVRHVDLGGDAHAGRSETSVMLALAPALVRLDAAEPGATAPLAEVIGRLRSEGVRAVSPNGVLGDPSGASAEEGRALLQRVTDAIVAEVAGW